MGKTIIWSNNALNQLEDIHFYILFETKSIRIADKVIEKIFDSTQILKTSSEIYELDEQRNTNDGSFRAFYVYSYKISFRIVSQEIQILRVQHTSRKPKNWK